jgi:nitrate reductase gamma subunit
MDFKTYLNQFLFGYYPYLALAVFFVGSLIRFDREQYTWKSDSSQFLRAGQLRWGSNLFHIGVLGIFFGHLFGLLTPLEVWHALGVSPAAKQMVAMVGGGIAGALGIIGAAMLFVRRVGDARIRATSKPMDIVILALLVVQLALGLLTIPFSAQHLDGSEMLKLVGWAQRIWTFQPGAADMIANVPIMFKLHLFLGLTFFLLFPFSRLVHIWSGFASVFYVLRPYQLMRSRGASR